MARKFTVDDYIWLTSEEISKPTRGGLHEVLIDYWWPVDKDGRVALYNPTNGHGRRRFRSGYPQCNPNKDFSWKVAQTCAPDIFVGVVQIPLAMYKVDPRDWSET